MKKIKMFINRLSKFSGEFVNIQIVLTFMTVGAFIITLFERKFVTWLELFLALSLISMAVNNYKIYKRKLITIIYIIVAIVLFILFILRLFGIGV